MLRYISLNAILTVDFVSCCITGISPTAFPHSTASHCASIIISREDQFSPENGTVCLPIGIQCRYDTVSVVVCRWFSFFVPCHICLFIRLHSRYQALHLSWYVFRNWHSAVLYAPQTAWLLKYQNVSTFNIHRTSLWTYKSDNYFVIDVKMYPIWVCITMAIWPTLFYHIADLQVDRTHHPFWSPPDEIRPTDAGTQNRTHANSKFLY